MSSKKTKADILLSNIEVIKDLLKNLYTIPQQLNYIYENTQGKFSVSDTTYMKFLNDYLNDEYIRYKKNLYFKIRISKIKVAVKEHPVSEVQFKRLNFDGYINGTTKLDLTVDDYNHFMIRYFTF
ncbi:hypothetical protein [Halarcobacter bivalviorum]|uniref:hypothetical protein n=1 Tax=Halarcobacter bivalviorum TaxID=663364 RepID=UPI00100B872C|nr:hypothetical protein [Halarcobacter bivalviorum]RXK05382.1 hypothetical protein CRU97_08550 [Halarcobacter bivalviorum]